jgi:hypothetical protein
VHDGRGARWKHPCIGVSSWHVSAAISLSDLVEQGEFDDQPPVPLGHDPGDPLEWLGLAVGELPYLTSSARTIDDINWASHAPHAARVHLRLIDAYAEQLAASGVLIHRALLRHVQRNPALGAIPEILADVDFMSHALIEDHPPLSRRADLLQGGYVTALAAAVQGSGEGGTPAVVGEALTRALATLLGHARLNARDRVVVAERAGR